MSAENGEKKYIVPEGFTMSSWFFLGDLPLSQGAKFTYAVLATCSQKRDYGWATLEFIAKRVSAAPRTVRRYLGELVEAKFIELTNEKLMGERRLIYRFLNHVYLDFEKVKAERENPPLRFEDLQKENQGLAASSECRSSENSDKNAAKMSEKSVKNDTRLYKEESYGNEEEKGIIPHTSPVESSELEAAGVATPSDAGKVGVEFSPEEEQEPDDPEWAKAKKILAEELSAYDLQAFIAPPLIRACGNPCGFACSKSIFSAFNQAAYR